MPDEWLTLEVLKERGSQSYLAASLASVKAINPPPRLLTKVTISVCRAFNAFNWVEVIPPYVLLSLEAI